MTTKGFIPLKSGWWKKEETISIPKGMDLVVGERGAVRETALVLYGFDEIGEFDSDFINPVYGFMDCKEGA